MPYSAGWGPDRAEGGRSALNSPASLDVAPPGNSTGVVVLFRSGLAGQVWLAPEKARFAGWRLLTVLSSLRLAVRGTTAPYWMRGGSQPGRRAGRLPGRGPGDGTPAGGKKPAGRSSRFRGQVKQDPDQAHSGA